MKLHGAIPQMKIDGAKGELELALVSFFGVEGMASLQARVENYDAAKKEMVIRVLRGEEKRLVAALALSGEFAGVQARLECLKISGTIRGLEAD